LPPIGVRGSENAGFPTPNLEPLLPSLQNVRYRDGERGEGGRGERLAGPGARGEAIESVARVGISFDRLGGEINDPCLRDPCCGIERQFRASIVGEG